MLEINGGGHARGSRRICAVARAVADDTTPRRAVVATVEARASPTTRVCLDVDPHHAGRRGGGILRDMSVRTGMLALWAWLFVVAGCDDATENAAANQPAAKSGEAPAGPEAGATMVGSCAQTHSHRCIEYDARNAARGKTGCETAPPHARGVWSNTPCDRAGVLASCDLGNSAEHHKGGADLDSAKQSCTLRVGTWSTP